MSQFASARQYAPATQRNRESILAVLQACLPPTGTVLEIASGTGEHAIFFAPRLCPRNWLPSDPDPIARSSIRAWQAESPCPGLYPPLALDVREPTWAIEQPLPPEWSELDLLTHPVRAMVNINMIHIAPWSVCVGLMAGASRILPPNGILYLYGPFKQQGQHTAASNERFDQSLQSQNPEWGVRDLEDVIAIAQAHSLQWVSSLAMPANNLSVIFSRV